MTVLENRGHDWTQLGGYSHTMTLTTIDNYLVSGTSESLHIGGGLQR
jgi:hypothetical protein